jgi:hypothetical protein
MSSTWRAFPIVAGVLVTTAFLVSMLDATESHFVPQVSDLYLVCQYARAMAEGHPFQYNLGEAPSTGATSLLHTVVLAAAHAVGIRGEGLVAFAVLLGAGFYLGSIALGLRVGTLLATEREGLVAGALIALGGPVVWGFLYGSDIALFLFLSLWLMKGVVQSWRDATPHAMALPAVLLALARPEGLPIAVLLAAAWSLGPGRHHGTRARLIAWLPTLAGLSVLGLYRVLTGQWLGTSLADKSLFANYGLTEGLALWSEYVVDVCRGLLLGMYPSQVPVGFARGWASLYFPPLGLILVLACVTRAPAALRTPLRVWAVVLGVVSALVTPNLFMGVHFNRYVLWMVPSLLVMAAVGLGAATRLLARDDDALERSLFRAGAGLWLLLGLFATLRFATLYGEMAGEVYRRDVKTAEWITRHLPHGVGMAGLATSIEYLTGHRNVNLHGVTSPAFFGNTRAEREAGLFEAFSHVPEAERPTYLITSVGTQEASALYRELVEGAPLFRSASFGDELLIYRMRYDLVGKNGRLFLPESVRAVEGLHEVDRLNVCDSRDEAAHAYVVRSRLAGLELHGTPRIDSYPGTPPEVVADAGRAILGSESFLVQTPQKRDLVVVMRTATSAVANVLQASGTGAYGLEFPEAGVRLQVGDQALERWSFRPRPGWDEVVLRVPGALLAAGKTRLTFAGRYAAFHYWFYQ